MVINLAGEPIFDKRWDEAQKQCLLDSRVHITQQLVELINRSNQPPHTFISGSATGYYGHNDQITLTEKMPAADDFQGQLCKQWKIPLYRQILESVYYAPA